MKKYIIIFFVLTLFSFAACDVEYYDTPNVPSAPPTAALFNQATYSAVYSSYDAWFMGRFTLIMMQYWQQTEYTDEDRYSFRDAQRNYWGTFYRILEDYHQVIIFNTDEATKNSALAYGANENQIACTRIMMSWIFNQMADTWGDIPYFSYGSSNPDFQALTLSGGSEAILTPVYANQADVYADILNELSEAADQLDETLPGFTQGDNIYNGDVAKWKKFANSLRLRIALKIRGVNATLANQHIADAIADGVFESNDDNAGFTYEASDKNASPFYIAYNVDNRKDFAPGHSFVELLKGEDLLSPAGASITTNPFPGLLDPRIHIFVDPNGDGNYVGMPIANSSSEAATIKFESLPGDAIINVPNTTDYLMEYSEVEFILSELNTWDQAHYEAGVEASLEKWGVPAGDITTFIASLPAANQETVITQKYIALYMQAHTAWVEYRRTGYPATLIKYNMNYRFSNPANPAQFYDYTFTPITEVTDIPFRMKYPVEEFTLNNTNYVSASDKLANGDLQSSKLWWDVN
jgi:hypothetical protein